MAGTRQPGLAIATAAGIAISAGAMYVMQKDVKAKEGGASMYKSDSQKTPETAPPADQKLSSSDVEQIVAHNRTRAK